MLGSEVRVASDRGAMDRAAGRTHARHQPDLAERQHHRIRAGPHLDTSGRSVLRRFPVATGNRGVQGFLHPRLERGLRKPRARLPEEGHVSARRRRLPRCKHRGPARRSYAHHRVSFPPRELRRSLGHRAGTGPRPRPRIHLAPPRETADRRFADARIGGLEKLRERPRGTLA